MTGDIALHTVHVRHYLRSTIAIVMLESYDINSMSWSGPFYLQATDVPLPHVPRRELENVSTEPSDSYIHFRASLVIYVEVLRQKNLLRKSGATFGIAFNHILTASRLYPRLGLCPDGFSKCLMLST